MGKVRFFSSDGEHYITVRAEELDPGNKHVIHVKVRKRRNVPFTSTPKVRSKPATVEQTIASDPMAATKILAALADIQQGVESGVYQSVILGTVYKSDELQLSIMLGKSKWKNIPADNYAEALISYAEELDLVAVELPPPTPLKGGQGSKP